MIENLVVFMDEISNTHYLHEQETYISRFNFMRAVESRLTFFKVSYHFFLLSLTLKLKRIYCLLFFLGGDSA